MDLLHDWSDEVKPHVHVTGYSSHAAGEPERCYLRIVEQPRRVYYKTRLYQISEYVSDCVGFHKTNRWFDRRHSERCNNDCKDSGLSRGQRRGDDGEMHDFEQVMCHYDPPALRLELATRYLEYFSVKELGDVEVSRDVYNHIFFNDRKVV